MGDSSSTSNTYESMHTKNVLKLIKEYSPSTIKGIAEDRLNAWKDVEINIGVTGAVNAGKSSFINAIRKVNDDDEGAAETGPNDTTEKVYVYSDPKNENIKYWDLPGFGTREKRNIETYWQNFGLNKYDAFLVISEGCFTQNDWLLTQKVKAMEKPYFFVRTKIDQDVRNETRKKSVDEDSVLSSIRQKCVESLRQFGDSDEIVFLISNHEPDKWDFARLTVAILCGLPPALQESLALTVDLLTTKSKEILKQKVDALRGRIWMVASASFAGALIPVPGVSITADLALLTREVNLYKSQLGLPEENSSQFQRMSKENQARFRKFCVSGLMEIANLLALYAASSTVEEASRFIPIIGTVIAGSISFATTYHFLQQCLNELEKAALDYLDDVREDAYDELYID